MKQTFRIYGTLAFLLGSFTSMLCGYIGMQVSVKNNYKVTLYAN